MRAHLFITPYFPPLSDSGVKRAVHLVRHLPSFGWAPVVLATRAVNEPEDWSLLDAVPRETIVSYGYSGRLRPALKQAGQLLGPVRKRVLRRNGGRPPGGPPSSTDAGGKPKRDWTFLTPFDRFLADTPAGIRAGARLIREHGLRAIHVSADPWSGLVAAYALHRRTGVPLVVDLRDPWSTHEGKMALRPALSRHWLRAFEAALFRAAAAVVLNTETAREAYVAAYQGRLPPDRFHCIRNAFDAGLFHAGEPERRPGFTLLYFGTFRKFVGPELLLQGFARFVAREDLTPGEARLLVVGHVTPAHLRRAAALGLDGFVESRAAVPFRESLPVLSGADALALVVEPACQQQIPGKLYDYLAAGRPILAVSANAEVNALIEDAGAGLAAPYDEPEATADRLATLYRESRAGTPRVVAPEVLDAFTAREQARRLAGLLDGAAR